MPRLAMRIKPTSFSIRKLSLKNTDFAAFIVIPAHRIREVSAQLDGPGKSVRRQSRSGLLLPLPQTATNTHSKGLKTTLRIPERKASSEPYHRIKNAPALFTSPWLMDADQRSIQRSRTKGYITFTRRDRLDEFWRFSDRGRKISIGKEGDSPAPRASPV